MHQHTIGQTTTGTPYEYQAFGLRVVSSMELPELLAANQANLIEHIEVCIKEVTFDSSLFEENLFENGFRFLEKELFIRIGKVGYFHVANENTIYFQRDPQQPPGSVQDRDIRVFLLGSCLGAVLQLRGYFPLHASVVAIQDAAVGFIGPSGAGKSTTLAMFSQLGHPVMTDDVAAIDFSGLFARVVPAYPQIKLNSDSADTLALPKESLKWINRFRSKYCKRCDENFSTTTHTLRALFILETETQTDRLDVRIKRLKGAEKFTAIIQNSYRQFFHSHFGIQQTVAEQVARLCGQCEVYKLYRPLFLSEGSLEKTRKAIYQTLEIE